jgi:multidrug resistance efflux pump
VAKLEQELINAQTAMDTALVAVDDARDRIDACRLLAPSKGEVKELRVAVYDQVEAGEAVIVIDPQDHFYLFNKSLAIFSFIAFLVFLGIHVLAF